MTISPRIRRNVAALASVGIAATPLLTLSAPALAADSCGTTDPAATEVSAGICEVSFSTAGTYNFTAPTGVTKLTAIVVGAGGGTASYYGTYGGGGGDVIFVSDVDVSAPISIAVGAGTDGSAPQAGESFVNTDVAAGGFSGTYASTGSTEFGGMSGSGEPGEGFYWTGVDNTASGGGAGGAGGDAGQGIPGLGLSASEVANDASLWPSYVGEPVYGAGGNPAINPGSASDTAGEGASVGGTGIGNDGLVVLRWAPFTPAEALVNTGLTTWGILLGAMFAGVLFFFASGSFSAKSRLQFAGSRDRLVTLLRDADARLSATEKTARDDDN